MMKTALKPDLNQKLSVLAKVIPVL